MFDVLHRRLSVGLRPALAGVLFFGLTIALAVNGGQTAWHAGGKNLRGLACANTVWQYMTTEIPGSLRDYAPCAMDFDSVGTVWHIDQYKDENVRYRMLAGLIRDAGKRGYPPADESLTHIQFWLIPALWAAAPRIENAIRMPPSESREKTYAEIRAQMRFLLDQMAENYAVISRQGKSPAPGSEAAFRRMLSSGSDLIQAGDTAIYHHRAGFVTALDAYQRALQQLWSAQQDVLISHQAGILADTRQHLLFQVGAMGVLALIFFLLLRMENRRVSQYFQARSEELSEARQALAQSQAHHAADRLAGAQALRALKAVVRRNMTLVTSAIAQGIRALDPVRLDFSLTTELPHRYEGLKQDFNAGIARLADRQAAQDAEVHQLREACRIAGEKYQATDLQHQAEKKACAAEKAAHFRALAHFITDLAAAVSALTGRDVLCAFDPAMPDFSALLRAFHAALQPLAAGLADLGTRVETLSGACLQIQHLSGDIAASTDSCALRQARAVSELTDLYVKIEKSLAATQAAEKMADRLGQVAARGQVQLQQAVQTLQDMSGTDEKFRHLAEATDTLAFHSNLLALDVGPGSAAVVPAARTLAAHAVDVAHNMHREISSAAHALHTETDLAGDVGTTLSRILADITALSGQLQDLMQVRQAELQALRKTDAALHMQDPDLRKTSMLVEQCVHFSETLAGNVRDMASRTQHIFPR